MTADELMRLAQRLRNAGAYTNAATLKAAHGDHFVERQSLVATRLIDEVVEELERQAKRLTTWDDVT